MAEQYQLKGIAFPFKVGVKGGAEMSVANSQTPQKIIEHYEQILGTNPNERSMEYDIYSQIEDLIFETDDETLRTVVQYLVREALNRLEPNATVNDVVVGTIGANKNAVVAAVINFTVNFTGNTYNSVIALEKGVT